MEFLKDIKSFVSCKQVFCGIDVHFKHWDLCFVCDGEVIEKFRLTTNYELLITRLRKYEHARKISFVYEAGFCGFWLYRKLISDNYDCIVTPPSKMLKSQNKVKTDKRDAQKLAFYLSAGLLKSVYVPSIEIESDRRVIRRRAQIVKKQTRAKNQIKSFLHLHGLKTPEGIKSSWSNRYLLWLEGLHFDYQSDNFTLSGLIKSYRRIREDLVEVTRYIRVLSKSERYKKDYKRITSARGVGLITAMTFLLEIFNFTRFSSADHFSSFLGMTPSQFSTGDKVRLGHITREGNAHVRRVLTESAWIVIKHDPHLREK
jgi:transposase